MFIRAEGEIVSGRTAPEPTVMVMGSKVSGFRYSLESEHWEKCHLHAAPEGMRHAGMRARRRIVEV